MRDRLRRARRGRCDARKRSTCHTRLSNRARCHRPNKLRTATLRASGKRQGACAHRFHGGHHYVLEALLLDYPEWNLEQCRYFVWQGGIVVCNHEKSCTKPFKGFHLELKFSRRIRAGQCGGPPGRPCPIRRFAFWRDRAHHDSHQRLRAGIDRAAGFCALRFSGYWRYGFASYPIVRPGASVAAANRGGAEVRSLSVLYRLSGASRDKIGKPDALRPSGSE